MIKNRFKKLSILALSTVCLLASAPTHAMDSEDKSLSASAFGSSSLGMSQLQQSFVSDLSQLSEEQITLMSQFMSSVRQGGLSTSSLDFAAMLYKQEFESLNNSIKSPLWPANTHPGKMCDAFGALSSIYGAVLGYYEISSELEVLKSLSKNLDKESSNDLTKFLLNLSVDDINLINNQSYMITFLRMLKPLNLQPCMQVLVQLGINDWHTQDTLQQLLHFQTYQPIFMNCIGTKRGSFFVKMTSFYESLIQQVQTMYMQGDMQQQQNVREKLKASITEQFNQIFHINGKPYFNIVDNGDLIDVQFSKWLNILSILPRYTVQNWGVKGPKLDDFLGQVDWANKALDASSTNKKMYSGAPISPYTVSLTQTSKDDKAETPEFLKEVIKEHAESHKEELDSWGRVKGIMPMLQKVVKLFEDVGDTVSKKGRIS